MRVTSLTLRARTTHLVVPLWCANGFVRRHPIALESRTCRSRARMLWSIRCRRQQLKAHLQGSARHVQIERPHGQSPVHTAATCNMCHVHGHVHVHVHAACACCMCMHVEVRYARRAQRTAEDTRHVQFRTSGRCTSTAVRGYGYSCLPYFTIPY